MLINIVALVIFRRKNTNRKGHTKIYLCAKRLQASLSQRRGGICI